MTSSWFYAIGGETSAGYAVNGATVVFQLGGTVSGGVPPYTFTFINTTAPFEPTGSFTYGASSSTSGSKNFTVTGTNETLATAMYISVEDSASSVVSAEPSGSVIFNATGHA